MARNWPGGDNYISTAAGSLGAAGTGAYTIIVLFQPVATQNAGFISLYQGGLLRREVLVDTSTFFGQGDFSGFGTLTSGAWQYIAQSKAAGTNVYRWHHLNYGDAPNTTVHQDGTGTHGDFGAIDEARIGEADNNGRGDIAAEAVYDRVLSDAEIESAFTTALADWNALGPVAIWALNQAATTDPVIDGTGNGADEVATVGTVGLAADPPGFDYSLTGVTAEFDITLPALTTEVTADVGVTATFTTTLPALSASVTGSVESGATFTITLPSLDVALEAELPVDAEFDITLPSLTSHIVATSTGTGDTFVTALSEQLLACLCEAVSLQPNPPEHCCYRVGLEVAHDAGINQDLCCEGIAYVALGDSFPSDRAPEQDIQRQADAACAPPSWIQLFKVGIIRCVPTGDEFNPPSCTDWNTAHTQNIADALSLRQAQCCMRDWIRASETFMGMTVIMDRQVQGSPLGGCVERSFTISIQFPNDCNC